MRMDAVKPGMIVKVNNNRHIVRSVEDRKGTAQVILTTRCDNLEDDLIIGYYSNPIVVEKV